MTNSAIGGALTKQIVCPRKQFNLLGVFAYSPEWARFGLHRGLFPETKLSARAENSVGEAGKFRLAPKFLPGKKNVCPDRQSGRLIHKNVLT
jgi:hypothetical protein